DGEGEGLGRAGVDAAERGAAVVLDLDIEGAAARNVVVQRVGEGAVSADAGQDGEQTGVADVADGVGQHRLPRLIRCRHRVAIGAEGRPAGDRVGARVFVRRRVTGDEA